MIESTLSSRAPDAPPQSVPFAEATRVWLRIAALSFGGPAGQIALMHRVLVEEKRWIGEARFLHALNFCMLLPGPEAQQLAIYLGWLLNGVRGGVTAGVLFVLPGFLAILGLSIAYVAFGDVGAVAGVFFGVKAAVLAIVLQAVARIGSRALRSRAAVMVAAVAFVAIFGFGAPFPAIVLGAGLFGFVASRLGSDAFAGGGHGAGGAPEDDGAASRLTAGSGDRGAMRAAAISLALWLGPVAALAALLGPDQIFARLAIFFSQMAVVTFGGAYAVLAYVAQAAVDTYGWLSPREMLDGLGLAETTPGPLIMVVQFVGFLAAFRNPGTLDPYAAAILASALVAWVTFAPSFFWIFLGAPHVERLRGNRALSGALAAITAAVVGVILNLAIWFGLHVLFARTTPLEVFGLRLDIPDPSSLDPAAFALFVLALIATFRFRVGVPLLLLACAALGVLAEMAGLVR